MHQAKLTLRASSKILCAGVITLLASCADTQFLAGTRVDDPAAVGTRMQFCTPGFRAYFDEFTLTDLQNSYFSKYTVEELLTAPNKVRRVAAATDSRVVQNPRVLAPLSLSFDEVRNRGGVWSSGRTNVHIFGSTDTDHAVYEFEYPNPPSNFVGVGIVLPGTYPMPAAANKRYWYKLPATVSVDRFSAWVKPYAVESDSIAAQGLPINRKLVYGQSVAATAVPEGAPMLRVKALTTVQNHKDPTTDKQPVLYTARSRLLQPRSPQNSVYEIVPYDPERIPACN